MTRVLIGASSEAARAGLVSLLAMDPAFQVAGSFSIDRALAQLGEIQPDVVLLDVESLADEAASLGIESGGAPLSSALVLLTDNMEKFLARDALRSGARAILPREAKAEEICAAIQASLAGLVVLHPDAFDAVLPRAGEPEPDDADQILTPREVEVLRIIAEGLGNKEIASKLSISDHTVKFHISSILAKLGASNRAEAVTIGIREGLIMI